MSFKDAFRKLIKQSNLTSQELATKLNLPINTIKSWENGTSEPNIENIFLINQFFDGQLEKLLNPNLSNKKVILNCQTIKEFLTTKKSSAKLTAAGVSCCIISVIPILFGVAASKLNYSNFVLGTSIILCLLLIAFSVGLFIYSDALMKPFSNLKNQSFSLPEDEKDILQLTEKKNYLAHAKKLALGISLCIISAIPIFVGIFFTNFTTRSLNNLMLLMVSVMLLIISLGINIIIKAESTKEAYDILLQKGDYSPTAKYLQRSLETFNSIFWGLITILYLGTSFLTHQWESTWIIWPIAGIIYAIINTIFKAKKEV